AAIVQRLTRQKEIIHMGILSWLIVGLIAGWLANQVMRRGRGNIVTDIVVGILGGLVGGFLAANLFGIPDAVNGINVGSIVVAFLGAVAAIAIIRALPGRSPV
ncbi:MAG: GlsB/YeaQ/YmgE family stress response membrane protein, partial [Anaerolineales bacterium]